MEWSPQDISSGGEPRHRPVTVFLATLAVVLAVGVVAAGVVAGVQGPLDTRETANTQAGVESLLAQDIDADAVVLAAEIRPDGDADWRVTYQLTLDSEERVTAFEELRDDVETGPGAYLDPFEDRMETTAANAAETTGREMRVEAFSVEAERETQPQGALGLVTFRFDWVGFAAVDDDTIRAGDALDRLILGDGERLVLSWPAEFSHQTSSPAPDTVEQQRVVWRGPVEFDDGQPRTELTTDDEIDTRLALAALGAVVGGLAVAVLVWRRRTGTDPPDSAETAATGGTEPQEGGAGEQGPPPELLSNEERVLRLLEQNGGRMKQKAVAEELDWTAAKTSQVVSDLREQGTVESFRLGRENVLTLPDVDIVGTGDDEQSPPDGAA